MTELPQQETDEHPTGHYRLAGSALMSLGGLGIILAITLVLALEAELGFIDGQSMAAISSTMFLTGLWMFSFGGKNV
jgi:hypothetical protein